MKKDKQPDNSILFEKYKLIVNARNFHYGNFNKWMTYFYVATGAIFIGYTQVLVAKNLPSKDEIEVVVLLLGYITGLLLYWSSKGYYYWNISFIMLINHYEKHILNWSKEESIYSVFADKSVQNKYWSPISGANFSTSKIAILFAYIISIAWGTVLAYKLSCYWFNYNCMPLSFATSLVLTYLLSVLLGKKEASKNPDIQNSLNPKKQHFLWSNTVPLDDLKLQQDKPRGTNTKIQMGNDEFILYIRKKYPNCNLKNDFIGKQIWIWLKNNDAVKIEKNKPCVWGEEAQNINEEMLPKTATQFEFRRSILPELYIYIDDLVK
nr:hypothetical protein [uncultured Carboxylicivirga sp.]